jgi:hypothetical protein
VALDVWLNGVGELPYLEIAERMEHVAAFEYNDGYFGHLSQYWDRLEEEFGLIDPWDTVSFNGAGLDALIECLTDARTDAASLPEAWSVHVGTLMSDPPEALYVPVQKHALLELVDRLLEAAARARLAGKQLLFFGD